jgi:protein tyrosine phosphatase (PTP) superfamily phosphohydrolase (DUF442 family)
MRAIRFWSLAGAALLVPCFGGCSHYCERPSYPPGPPVVAPGAPYPQGSVVVPGQPAPVAPPAFPAAPQRTSFSPAQTVEPQVQGWQPADSAVRLAAPEPAAGDPLTQGTRLGPPQPPVPSGPPRPIVSEDRLPPPAMPVGIPQYALARPRVATGLRPMLDEGLDWLQTNGYHTILHIKRPDTDDSADRRQVEKRGLKYLSLDVSPQSLTRQTVDDFDRVVADATGLPLFVYDRDGALAGALWYLYFRTAEHESDDVARVRAGALGLREDRDDAHREMWLAVQRFLSEQSR